MEKLDDTGNCFEVKPIFTEEESPFVDVDNKRWSYEAIKKITELRLLVPFKNENGNKFKPTQSVTREELAVALDKIINILYK